MQIGLNIVLGFLDRSQPDPTNAQINWTCPAHWNAKVIFSITWYGRRRIYGLLAPLINCRLRLFSAKVHAGMQIMWLTSATYHAMNEGSRVLVLFSSIDQFINTIFGQIWYKWSKLVLPSSYLFRIIPSLIEWVTDEIPCSASKSCHPSNSRLSSIEHHFKLSPLSTD